MGTVGITNVRRDIVGQSTHVAGTLTMSSSYATGGDTITAALLGLEDLYYVIVGNSDGGYILAYDNVNDNLIKAFSAATTEVTATTDLSGESADFIAVGRGLAPLIG